MSPRKSQRPHRAALTRMLRATGLAQMPDEAPLVELLRSLADEIDNGGGSRPRIEYRNALKDARAVLNAAAKPVRGTKAPAEKVAEEPEPASPAGVPDNLLQFEQKHGLA
ncbi:hypothetical protein [Microbacterium sp. NPDC064943]